MSLANPDVDYEDGGINLQDGSEGMLYQVWTGYIENNNITLTAPNQSAPTIIYSGTSLSDLSFTFDTNMNPHAVFTDGGVPKLLWYDTTIPAQAIMTLEWNDIAAIFLDDKRPRQTGIADIIVFYVRSESLYYRLQRDRFGTEYLLKAAVGDSGVVVVGMGSNLR